MKYYKDLIIKREFFISSKALILGISLKENELAKEEWIDELSIKKGDIVTYKNKNYKIVSVQSYRKLSNNKQNQNIELILNV